MLTLHYDRKNLQNAAQDILAIPACPLAMQHVETGISVEDLIWKHIEHWLNSSNTGFSPGSIVPFLEAFHPLAFDEVCCTIYVAQGTVNSIRKGLDANLATTGQPLNIGFYCLS